DSLDLLVLESAYLHQVANTLHQESLKVGALDVGRQIRDPGNLAGSIEHRPRRRPNGYTGHTIEIDENLDHPLRRAAKPIWIARSRWFLARGEQPDDRVQLVRQRDGRPCHGA